MDFLKKHYEKLILSVVLVAVAAAAFLLLIKVGQVKEDLANQLQERTRRAGRELKAVDLTTNEMAVAKIADGFAVPLAPDHGAFNPGTWDRENNQLRRKDPRAVLARLEVREIVPLNLVVSFTGVAGLADSPRYQFSITREYEKSAAKRRPTASSLTPGSKNDLFQLREVKGLPTAPTELVCELAESSQRFVVSGEQSLILPRGYAANLRFDNRDLGVKRTDDTLNLAGATYKIVAITKDELVVSAPNQVRTSLRLTSAP